MLLAIDVGNTNIHLGVFLTDGSAATAALAPVDHWRIRTERERTSDEHAVLIRSLLETAGLGFDDLTGVALCSVVPPLAPALREFARRRVGLEPELVGESLKPDLEIRYQPPTAVGADRLVDAVAVKTRYGYPAVVVDFGTATTFDAIDRDGAYLGGAIAAGVGLSLDALFRTASHLPRIELRRPPRVIGSNTVSAMQSGAYFGFVGQVEGIVRRFRQELGPDVKVVATGGLAELIAGDSPEIDAVEPLLTLDGLRLVWESAHRDRRPGDGLEDRTT